MMTNFKDITLISTEMEKFQYLEANFSPVQRARLLLYVDKIKNMKELSVFELYGFKKNSFKIVKKYKNDPQHLFPLLTPVQQYSEPVNSTKVNERIESKLEIMKQMFQSEVEGQKANPKIIGNNPNLQTPAFESSNEKDPKQAALDNLEQIDFFSFPDSSEDESDNESIMDLKDFMDSNIDLDNEDISV